MGSGQSYLNSFNPELYQGLWFEIGKYPTSFQGNCDTATAEYTLQDNYINVLNKCIKNNKVIRSITGKARLTPLPGVFLIKFDQAFTPESSYIVLWTDYDNWSFVGSSFSNYFWVLSRKPTINQQDYDFIVMKTKQLGYDPNRINFNTPNLDFN